MTNKKKANRAIVDKILVVENHVAGSLKEIYSLGSFLRLFSQLG